MKNVVLLGLMGSGKTTIGQMLAKDLGRNFIDTDDIIEKNWDMNVGELIAIKGEGFYRDQETDALRSLLGLDNIIVSTGGGRLDEDESWQIMRKLGLIIYMSHSPKKIASHLDLARHGVWIGDPDTVLEKVKSMLVARHSQYYRADLVVEAGDMSTKEVCSYVEHRIV